MSGDGDTSVEQFCRRNVEPMGVESDHIHIVLLTEGRLFFIFIKNIGRHPPAA
jgi:hypothetical protein